MEQQLRRAMRRLEAIKRHEQRLSRSPRHGPGEPPPQPPAPPRSSAPPQPPAPPEGRTAPDARAEMPPTPDTLRPFRGPDGRPFGMRGPNPPVLSPRVECRLQDLEEKMDRLLKELENLKSEKKDKAKEHEERSPRA